MTRDIALRLDGMLDGVIAGLDAFAFHAKGNMSSEEFQQFVVLVGNSMSCVVDISARLHSIFPDIVPDELRPRSGH